jgi:hypothetical protein
MSACWPSSRDQTYCTIDRDPQWDNFLGGQMWQLWP